VLYDLGLVHTKEPFQKLLNPGMILGHSYRYYDTNLSDAPGAKTDVYSAEEVRIEGETAIHQHSGEELKPRWVSASAVKWNEQGQPLHPTIEKLVLEEVTEKMSKSRGNVVNPDEVIAEYGTDTMRLYEMFMGPLEKGAPWSSESIPGMFRFLQRAQRLIRGENDDPGTLASIVDGTGTDEQARLTARTIQGVTQDIEEMGFNTGISKLMVFVRDVTRDDPLPRHSAEAFVVMLSPFAPHLAEELWEALGKAPSVAHQPWPTYDPALIASPEMTIPLQVNGKLRSKIQVAADSTKEDVLAVARQDEKLQEWLEGKTPKKIIYVEKKLVNFVV